MDDIHRHLTNYPLAFNKYVRTAVHVLCGVCMCVPLFVVKTSSQICGFVILTNTRTHANESFKAYTCILKKSFVRLRMSFPMRVRQRSDLSFRYS